MRRLLLIFFGYVVLLTACLQVEGSRPSDSEMSIHAEITIEEAKEQIPFEIKQPAVPFQVNETVARILDTNGGFDAVEIRYENPEEGKTLLLLITNSKSNTELGGEKGQLLANGVQTWNQSDDLTSAIYWREEGLTYLLASFLQRDGEIGPLYDHQELVGIANTLS